MILDKTFFDKNALLVAEQLLGKVIHHKYDKIILSAQIIETEAYFINEKGSHASLGYSESRKALFMPPGTIYMYYARGGDSLNFCCNGNGNAVLIKSGIPFLQNTNSDNMTEMMQKLNLKGNRVRKPLYLCSGQTLLCKSLGIKVPDWNCKTLQEGKLYLEDIGINPSRSIMAKRLGIPISRDEHLMYRFIDFNNIKYCTKNPLSVRKNIEGKDYIIKSA